MLDVTYRIDRLGIEQATARRGMMLILGLAPILLVALNEKERGIATIKANFYETRGWE